MRINSTILVIAVAGFVPLLQVSAADPDGQRQIHLQRLVLHDCGSCHGMRLKGGLGPALTADALKEKSEQMLVQTILSGRPGTAMPPWRPFLSESEAVWIIEQLQKGTIREH
jgi:cytochrome c55X